MNEWMDMQTIQVKWITLKGKIEEISFSFIAKMFEINKKIKRHNSNYVIPFAALGSLLSTQWTMKMQKGIMTLSNIGWKKLREKWCQHHLL